MNAPVVLFVYKRADHTQKVLEALNAAAIDETELFIFSDGWKDETDKKMVLEVRTVINAFAAESRFTKTTIIEADCNRGLANSIINGVTSIINKYEKVIVLEDDLVVSRNFLTYMNRALDFYADNKKIWSISGYSFQMKSLAAYEHDVYITGRGCCWGWATWRDRWQMVDWNVNDYKRFKHNWLLRNKFGKYGRDLPIMLDTQMYTNHDSWAIRWCYSEFNNQMFTIYPKKSLVSNIGNDGTGVHKSSLNARFDVTLDNSDPFSCFFENVAENKRIDKEFARRYRVSLWQSIKQEIRWLLIRCGLLNPNK